MVGHRGYERMVGLLEESGVRYAIHEGGAERVSEVSEGSPFPLESLVKTLVFQVNQSWVLVAVKAQDRIDYRRLADACGVNRSAITSPPPAVVEAALGVEVGGVSPIPLGDGVRVIVDSKVQDRDVIFCGAGKSGKTLELRVPDLLRLCHGEVASVVREHI